MIEFPCIYCGRALRVQDRPAGRRVKCPACGHVVMAGARQISEEKLPLVADGKATKQEASYWAGKSDQEIMECLLPKARTKDDQTKWVIKESFASLIPRYDDLTLFALSLSFVLLWLVNGDLEQDLVGAFTKEFATTNLWLTIAMVVALVGMVLSLINVFFQREKSGLEKSAMLIFAIAVASTMGLHSAIRDVFGGRRPAPAADHES
jgi:DNA-directed RNA polymerase subunit RPC12/RpoP